MATENINIIITTRGARVAQTRIRGIGRSSRLAATAVLGLGAALVGLGAFRAVRGLINLSDAATEVGNRIRTVTSSTAVFLSVQDRLFDVAARTGGAIADTARLFQRLSVGTRDLGVGTARVINVVEGLNAALIVSGSTAREASAALLQLGQGLASDNLSGEELRSLRENLPQLAQELADVLEQPIGALKELGRQGLLNAETVFPALEIAVERFQEKLENGEVIFTFAQAMNAVRNAFVKAFTIIQRSTGLTQELTKKIFSLSDGLAERLVNALADVIDFLAKGATNFEIVKNAIGDVTAVLGVMLKAFLILTDIGGLIVDFLLAPLILARGVIGKIALAITKIGRAAGADSGIFSDEELAAQEGRVRESSEFLQALLDDMAERAKDIGKNLGVGLAGAGKEMSQLEKDARAFAQGLRDAANTPIPLKDDPDRDPADKGPDESVLEAAIKANLELVKIVRERRLEELEAINPRLKQIALLDEEIAKVAELEAAGADRILAEEEINAIIRERAELAAMTDFGQGLATGITDSFSEAFSSALKSGASFTEALATNLENAANNALVNGFEKAFEEMQKLLGEAFDAVANTVGEIFGEAFGGLGPVLGAALSGALQFVALQALSALLGGSGNKQSSSNANVQSAVTSTQAVRGIVAGPTEVAIANVGRNIAEAIDPLLQETVVQTGILRGILTSVQSGTAASGGSTAGATASLAFGSAPAATA